MIGPLLLGVAALSCGGLMGQSLASIKHTLPADVEEVSTAEQLASAIAANKNILVLNDIDASGINATLAANDGTYSSSFDGGFHRITNLTSPLFHRNAGTIKDLLITPDSGATISTDDDFGLLALSNSASGTIYGVGVEGDATVSILSAAEDKNISLFVSANEGTIHSCYYAGAASVTSTSPNAAFGFLVGQNAGQIHHCFAIGDFSFETSGYASVGKICGSLSSGGISSCLASGDNTLISTGDNSRFANIVPANGNESVENCFYQTGSKTLQNFDFNEQTTVGSVTDISDYLDQCAYQTSYFGDKGFRKYNDDKLYRFSPNAFDVGVDNGGVYTDSVAIDLGGKEAKLDGTSFASGILGNAGNHRLDVKYDDDYFKRYDFVVVASITGIADNGTYRKSASASFVSCDCLLDGKPYSSGTAISTIGNHTLSAVGTGGLQQDIHFTIEPFFEGIVDGVTFYGSTKIRVERDDGLGFTMNGELYSANQDILLTAPGEYTVLFQGVNGYSKAYRFFVELEAKTSDGTPLSHENNDFSESATFLLSHDQAYIDGTRYTSGTAYQVVGNHRLIIYGAQGQQEVFPFVIHPSINGVEDGKSYQLKCAFMVSSGRASLDGVQVETGVEIETNMPGSHALVISGDNGYEKTITFEVELRAWIETITTDFEYALVRSGGNVTLDGKPFEGTRITQLGGHTIVITGSDGKEYFRDTFRIKGNLNRIPTGRASYPALIPILDAEVYLDGKRIDCKTQEIRVTEKGYHSLSVIGSDFYQTYSFIYENQNPLMSIVYCAVLVVLSGAVVALIVIRRRKA